MNRAEAAANSERVVEFIKGAIKANKRTTGRRIAARLNEAGILTSCRREWTARAFYRFMQCRQLRMIDFVRGIA